MKALPDLPLLRKIGIKEDCPIPYWRCRTIRADEAPVRAEGVESLLTVMVVGVERPVRAVSASKDRNMDRKKVLLRKKSPSLSLLMKELALLIKLRQFSSRREKGLR